MNIENFLLQLTLGIIAFVVVVMITNDGVYLMMLLDRIYPSEPKTASPELKEELKKYGFTFEENESEN